MYKTQVFVNHVGDNLRTRMTHSLEVHQVSRSLASALGLNEPLCEAIALAHDLGHPPYGHAGEQILNQKMDGAGGFSHNKQSQRVVEVLERRSPEYSGLNLTLETRDGLKKHEEGRNPKTGEKVRFPSIEAQLVDLADSTAYHYHDVDDGIRENILDPAAMEKDLEIWQIACEAARQQHPKNEDTQLLWKRAANELLSLTIQDILEESHGRLGNSAPKSAAEARNSKRRMIGHSQDFRTMVAELHKYLYEHMYFREEVNWHVRRATDLLEHLFDALAANTTLIPERFHKTADSPERAICDYLAGMTDRYVERKSREMGILPG